MLTDRQKYCLEWLLHNPQSHLRWMRNGKDAYGPAHTWDAIEIAGNQGSIVIVAADWDAIGPFRKQTSFRDAGKVFVPNEAGMAALTEGQREK